ncbi:MAG: AMP-binding protein [Ignavibacteria bacterium]|nr:AMP-binding protein [Ignavibacteria bacterium]
MTVVAKSKILKLFHTLVIESPASMVHSLKSEKLRKLILGGSVLEEGYFIFSTEKLSDYTTQRSERDLKNRLVFIREENPLQCIFSIFLSWSNGLLPLLVSPSVTENEFRELLSRFKPGGVITKGLLVLTSFEDTLNPVLDDDAVVILTSGSSGKPKAVVHTFDSLMNAARRSNLACQLKVEDKWLLSLPIYHISGFSILMRSIVGGVNLVLTTSNNPENPEFYEAEIRKPNLVSFVATQLKGYIENISLSQTSYKMILVGGSAIDDKLLKDSIDRKLRLYKVYGSSETAAFIAGRDLESKKTGHQGDYKPLKGVRVDLDNGELTVKSDQLFDRYLDDPGLTASRKIDDTYHTGDEAMIFDDGSFSITGRMSRFIISGGINVDPLEVEAAIKEYSGIIEVFVFSVTNEKWGEAVSALLKTVEEFDIMEFHKFLKGRMSAHKIPKYYRIVDEIPVSAIGKYDPVRSREILFER